MVKKTAGPPPVKPLSADKMANMDQHMQSMQAMHDKMMAAKTLMNVKPLMAEHMKLMQGRHGHDEANGRRLCRAWAVKLAWGHGMAEAAACRPISLHVIR